MGDDGGGAGRATWWLRLVTAVLAAAPTALAALVAVVVLRVGDPPVSWIVAGAAVVPPLAAFVVRRRLLWLAAALPRLRHELRQADLDPPATAEVERSLDGRPTLRRLWHTVRWLRDPASQARTTAQRNLGPRAGAAVGTTAGAVERIVGLALLTGIAAWGTLALLLTLVVVALVGITG